MNKNLKAVSLIALILLVAVVFGAQVAQALRESTAPEPLPYGLTLQDTRATVEQRFGQPVEVHAPQAGFEPGLPDSGGSPDHMTYHAVYKRFGVTVVYDSPSPEDKGAKIIAVYSNE